ncbi:MAG: acyltransferase family protein [Acidobacteriia bacterium]|nr:acyltransferase family protein [Terriglobia bacterium]
MTAARISTQRIPALDFTKGALVLLMVLYHWLNYFFAPQGDIYKYLRFVTPSFIFISGFLISNVYLSKYNLSDPRLPRRLVQRGLKILAVFICLNVIISILVHDSYSGQILFRNVSWRNLIAMFVTGNTVVSGGKVAAFYILVPISYVLLLSAGLVIMCRLYKHVFHIACILCFMAIAVLYLNGLRSGNLELLAIGVCGLIVGYIPIGKLDTFVRHPYVLGLSYLCYLTAITIWNVIYPLLIIGVCLSLIVIYLVGAANVEPSRARIHVMLLGKYSLFAYIAQIAILQILYRSLRHSNLSIGVLGVSFILAFALTMISVEVVDRLRAKSVAVDGAYKTVFA